ncbi:MAG: hypothetical protein HYZ72_19965 [Deltaproteobacteria bacterium]|nr:hypothetical protein [Deltaproteobacteria bacterium]
MRLLTYPVPASAQFRYNRRLEMYKAVHVQEGREIVILDSHWAKGIEYLRALDQQDLLVCQGCKQPTTRANAVRAIVKANTESLH